jgi:hypothetical protein
LKNRIRFIKLEDESKAWLPSQSRRQDSPEEQTHSCWWIRHALGFGITSLVPEFFLPELNLLFLLNQGTASTAARRQEISDEVALKVVFATDIGALHEHGDPVETETAWSPEAQALAKASLVSLCVFREAMIQLTVVLTAL